MSASSDLRAVCRCLTLTPPENLPQLCPILVNHVLRCGTVLSASYDVKGSSTQSSMETAVLVHKLKTTLRALLEGKNPQGRFTAVVLIKTMVDVGGWECLRSSEPWIQGLLSLLRKQDSIATKELCIVTLTRLFALAHQYPALVRQIATPHVQPLITTCLQMISPSMPGHVLKVPVTFVETVAAALSTLIPLHPSTIRPSEGKIRYIFRHYLAPTSSDNLAVPQSLQAAACRLTNLLPHTAAKDGSSQEWTKAIDGYIRDCHRTADQIFRGVVEVWESTTDYITKSVSQLDAQPQGGSAANGYDLPPWHGLNAGVERLTGLLALLADCFECPTKSPVTLPLGAILDLTSRLALIQSPWRDADTLASNPAVGREEKDELRSAIPNIHIATIRLHLALASSLCQNSLPLAQDILSQLVVVFESSRHDGRIREAAYRLLAWLLRFTGPALSKMAVDSLVPLVHACCQDLLDQDDDNLANEPQPPQQHRPRPSHISDDAYGAASNIHASQCKSYNNASNSDDFLPNRSLSLSTSVRPSINMPQSCAAHELLPMLLSHLPQRYVRIESRSLMERTAIVTHHKRAMLASCLSPYRDRCGRCYASLLPFLVQQFPEGLDVEVLRCNLQAAKSGSPSGSLWDTPPSLLPEAVTPVSHLEQKPGSCSYNGQDLQSLASSSHLADAEAPDALAIPALSWAGAAAAINPSHYSESKSGHETRGFSHLGLHTMTEQPYATQMPRPSQQNPQLTLDVELANHPLDRARPLVVTATTGEPQGDDDSGAQQVRDSKGTSLTLLKRTGDSLMSPKTKKMAVASTRDITGELVTLVHMTTAGGKHGDGENSSDSGSSESIQVDMTMDGDDDKEDEEAE